MTKDSIFIPLCAILRMILIERIDNVLCELDQPGNGT